MQDGNLSNDFTVDADALEGFLSELTDLKKSVSESAGDLRSRIKSILDQQGYHKKALAVIRDIEAMSETQRADFLRTFNPMLEAMRSLKWDAEGNDMLEGLDEPTPSDAPVEQYEDEPDMEAEATTEDGLEDFNETAGDNVEPIHGDAA